MDTSTDRPYVHFSRADAAAQAGTGFQIPLGPGTYSYLIQQTGLELTAYSIELTVVPEPSTAVLVAMGLALVAVRRKRR